MNFVQEREVRFGSLRLCPMGIWAEGSVGKAGWVTGRGCYQCHYHVGALMGEEEGFVDVRDDVSLNFSFFLSAAAARTGGVLCCCAGAPQKWVTKGESEIQGASLFFPLPPSAPFLRQPS